VPYSIRTTLYPVGRLAKINGRRYYTTNEMGRTVRSVEHRLMMHRRRLHSIFRAKPLWMTKQR
jgi:hypothetical protein